jgi:glucose-1-phosphate cytidylyltransferase
MKIMILCGGQGIRLREETEFRPKALVSIGGIPILLHIMQRYIKYGFNDFILLLGHRGEQIKDYFLNYRAMSSDFAIECGDCDEGIRFYGNDGPHFSVTLVDTGEETATGGRIRKAARYLGDDQQFMVTYCDGVADIDLDKLMAFHRQHDKLATISVVQQASRFGMARVDELDRVTQFDEKPLLFDNWVNMGFMVFNRQVIDYLSGDQMLEQKPIKTLVEDGELMAYKHHGFFQQMDTYREYLLLNDLWNKGEAKWR